MRCFSIRQNQSLGSAHESVQYDFGYAWQFSYVHLIPLAIGLIALLLSIRFNRSRWLVASFRNHLAMGTLRDY